MDNSEFWRQIKQAWKQFNASRNPLWFPLALLLLTPLATLILFGMVLPFGLAQATGLDLNWWPVKSFFILLNVGLLYVTGVALLDNLYRQIQFSFSRGLDQEEPLVRLPESVTTGKAMLTPFLLTLAAKGLAGLLFIFKPLLFLCWMVFTPVPLISINREVGPWRAWMSAWQFFLDNRGLVIRLAIARIILLLSLALPLVALLLPLGKIIHLLLIVALVPVMCYWIYLLLPFYFYIPAYFFQPARGAIEPMKS